MMNTSGETETTRRDTPAVAVHHVITTPWASLTVRCLYCGKRAREEMRERLSDEEIAVRYGCRNCGRHQSRHYHESELARS